MRKIAARIGNSMNGRFTHTVRQRFGAFLIRSLVFVSGIGLPVAAWAQTAPQANEALNEGLRHLQQREPDKARAPLEAALQLAPDNEFRLKVFQALLQVYRTLPETEKMTEACEFIIRYSDSLSVRSSTANQLVSFYFQRGKVDEQLKRYRQILAAEADDYVALAMQAELARPAKLDRATQQEYRQRFERAEQKLAAEFALQKEQVAAHDESQRSWLWKEAALLWSKSGDHTKALAAAEQAEKTGPETRAILVHFWHAHLGDVYLAAAKPLDAARHFERAIASTTIPGYQDTYRVKLEAAKTKRTAP